VRRCFALALLAGCNQLFDIDPTMLETGAPLNPECPSDGVSVPQFRPDVHEIISRECFAYSVSESSGRAFGSCIGDNGVVFEEGPIDGALSPMQITPRPIDAYMAKAWLAPNGTELVVHQYVMATGQPTHHSLSVYTRNATSWTWSYDISQADDFITSGVPSATPERRIFEGTLYTYRELAERNGVWVDLGGGKWSDLFSSGVGDNMNLSPDGLRMTFTINFDVMYMDRPSLDAPFRAPVKLDSVGQARDAFMTEDCGKIYFTGLSSVFFRYQQ
jgi:hypothetical protein